MKIYAGFGVLLFSVSVAALPAARADVLSPAAVNGAASRASLAQKLADSAAPSASLVLPQPRKKWTVMVFMNGKNNMSECGFNDLAEMHKVGSGNDLNIVVEQGTLDEATGEYGGVRRLYVTKHSAENGKDVLLSSAKNRVDMGDWREASRFVNYSKKNFPADNYLLVMWNHGSGWKSIGKPLKPSSLERDRGVSYDDETGNDITTIEMRDMLKTVGGVNLLAYDACLMAELATNAEIASLAPYVVASEEVEPFPGYDYERVLGKIAADPSISPKDLAVHMVKAYAETYATSGENVTTSAVDSAALSAYLSKIKAFVQAAVKTTDPAALVSAYNKAYRFGGEPLADFGDFLSLTAAATADQNLKGIIAQLQAELAGQVVLANTALDNASGHAYGLSAYMPENKYDSEYDMLAFTKVTNWDKLVRFVTNRNTPPAPAPFPNPDGSLPPDL